MLPVCSSLEVVFFFFLHEALRLYGAESSSLVRVVILEQFYLKVKGRSDEKMGRY